MVDPFGAKGRVQDVGVDVVETALDVEKKRRNFKCWALECADSVHQGGTGVKGEERGEGDILVGMKESNMSGIVESRETTIFSRILENILEENNNKKGSGGVGRRLTRLVKNDPVGLLERGGVVPVL